MHRRAAASSPPWWQRAVQVLAVLGACWLVALFHVGRALAVQRAQAPQLIHAPLALPADPAAAGGAAAAAAAAAAAPPPPPHIPTSPPTTATASSPPPSARPLDETQGWAAAYPLTSNKAYLLSYRVHMPDAPRCQASAAQQEAMAYKSMTFFQSRDGTSSLSCEFRNPRSGRGYRCFAKRVVIHPDKIQMSQGGENVMDVMGRTDEQEMARLRPNAFVFGARGQCGVGMKLTSPVPPRPEPQQEQQQQKDQSLRELASHVSLTENYFKATHFGHELMQSLCGGVNYALTSGLASDHRALKHLIDNPPEVGEGGDAGGGTVPSSCASSWDDSTPYLLVHRYEYVNLYHTVTEVAAAYSSVQSARRSGFLGPDEKVRVVFNDGHAAGTLDEIWEAVFPGYKPLRLKSLKTEPLCASRLIIAEIGYASGLNIHPGDSEEFGRFGLAYDDFGRGDAYCVDEDALGVGRAVVKWANAEGISPSDTDPQRVLFVMRDTAKIPAHPRVPVSQEDRQKRIERSIANGNTELPPRVALLRSRGKDVNLVYLSSLSLAEQVRQLRRAHVIIGLHGAAFMHMLFTDPTRTMWLELSPADMIPRMHFVKVAARVGATFARLGSGVVSNTVQGQNSDFLNGAMMGYVFNGDMFDAVVRWSLLPTHEARLSEVSNGNAFKATKPQRHQQQQQQRRSSAGGRLSL